MVEVLLVFMIFYLILGSLWIAKTQIEISNVLFEILKELKKQNKIEEGKKFLKG